jgi:hypothetical protein
VNSPAAVRPFSPRIDRNYPKPKLKVPPGACDTHFHFIGPQKLFPLKSNHVFSRSTGVPLGAPMPPTPLAS